MSGKDTNPAVSAECRSANVVAYFALIYQCVGSVITFHNPPCLFLPILNTLSGIPAIQLKNRSFETLAPLD